MLLPRSRAFVLLSCLVALCGETNLAAQSGSANSVTKNSRGTIAEMKQKAQAGDAEAQANLGLAYHQGNGVPQDDWTAADWFRKGAEQGNAVAQNGLGHQYQIGRGVPRDLEQAFQWFKKSAKQKYPPAVMNVAVSYYNGDGVPEDMVAAYAWMLMADELGEKGAHEAVERTRDELGKRAGEGEDRLAELLEAGEELPKDEVAAARWHSKALEDGVTPTPAVPAVAFGQRKPKSGNEDRPPDTFDRSGPGGKVVPPKLIYGPSPEFGSDRTSSGTVILRLTVGTDGLPRDIEVTQSLTPDRDKEAIEAVKRWKFSPATINGQPVAVKVATQINFKGY